MNGEMRKAIDETELITKIRAGEHELFRHLVEAHQDRVYRVCLHVLSDAAAAQDLAQDTFVTAYQKLDQFDPTKGSISAWMLTIARRLCINAMKKLRPVSMADPPEMMGSSNDHPDRQASRNEAFQALDQALAKLSVDFRRCYMLAEVEELSHQEIAHIEGIAIGTVKSRVSRAKQILQGLLRSTYQESKERTHP